MFCQKCGNSNEDGVKYCVNCGAELEQISVGQTELSENETQSIPEPIVYSQPQYQPTIMVEADTQQPAGKGFSIASLVLGIIGITCCGFGIIPQILALIFGIVSRNKGCKNGMSVTGIILGILGIVMVIFIFAFAIITDAYDTDYLNSLYF